MFLYIDDILCKSDRAPTIPDMPAKSGGDSPGGSGVEYEYWSVATKGPPPEGQGWEAPSGGRSSYRRPKGSGGGGAPAAEDPAGTAAKQTPSTKKPKDPGKRPSARAIRTKQEEADGAGSGKVEPGKRRPSARADQKRRQAHNEKVDDALLSSGLPGKRYPGDKSRPTPPRRPNEDRPPSARADQKRRKDRQAAIDPPPKKKDEAGAALLSAVGKVMSKPESGKKVSKEDEAAAVAKYEGTKKPAGLPGKTDIGTADTVQMEAQTGAKAGGKESEVSGTPDTQMQPPPNQSGSTLPGVGKPNFKAKNKPGDDPKPAPKKVFDKMAGADQPAVQAVFSTDPKAYPNTKAADHYKIAVALENVGADPKVVSFHRKMGKDRAKNFTDVEHEALAQELHEGGAVQDATHHMGAAKKYKNTFKQDEVKAAKEKEAGEKKAAKEKEAGEKKAAKEKEAGEKKAAAEEAQYQKERATSRAKADKEKAKEQETKAADKKAGEIASADWSNISTEELTAMVGAQAAAREAGPDEEEEVVEEEDPQKKMRSVNLAAAWDRGAAMGQAVGQAAFNPKGAPGVLLLQYGMSGSVRAGQSMLTAARGNQENPNRAQSQGSEVEQSSLGKGLWFDCAIAEKVHMDTLKKGGAADSPDRVAAKHEGSYGRRPTGVAGAAIGLPDGMKNRDKSVEEDDEDEEKMDKSLSILKSLDAITRPYLASLPVEVECVFMVDVLGYPEHEVRKGLRSIRGSDRHKFNMWCHDRLSKSTSDLIGLVS